MRLFTVIGEDAAKRTEIVKKIARELKRRHRTVALILEEQQKEQEQQADKVIKGNTMSFGQAMDLEKYLPFITEEFLIVDHDIDMLPALSVDATKNDLTFGFVDDFADLGSLVDFVEEKAPVKMPFVFGNSCCGACEPKTCRGLLREIIAGRASVNDCPLNDQTVRVKINNTELSLVQFGQNIIRYTNAGLLSTLNGFEENAHIQIEIKPLNK